MFPIQPPAKIAALDLWANFCCTNRTHSSVGEMCTEAGETGVAMGLIFDIVVEGLES
jgi:hypothetical protein